MCPLFFLLCSFYFLAGPSPQVVESFWRPCRFSPRILGSPLVFFLDSSDCLVVLRRGRTAFFFGIGFPFFSPSSGQELCFPLWESQAYASPECFPPVKGYPLKPVRSRRLPGSLSFVAKGFFPPSADVFFRWRRVGRICLAFPVPFRRPLFLSAHGILLRSDLLRLLA